MEAHFEKPCDLSPDLIKSISLLIAEGGEVNNKTLRNRLLSAALIGYIVIDEKVVATAAIKKPHDTYLDNVSIKAESDRKY